MDGQRRRTNAARARELLPALRSRDVRLVAVSFVDNSGITRVKAVPLDQLERAAAWGIGASPSFDVFLFNDVAMLDAPDVPGVVGDLRLHPDLDRITPLADPTGWAWAPADRYDQDGQPYPQDQRGLARRAVDRLGALGCTARCAFEVEWTVGDATADDFVPGVRGPAYGFARLTHGADYLRAVVDALARQGVSVEQVHPEYGPGQCELSVAAQEPVAAADTYVLVRETIRAVSRTHSLRASFSPKVLVDGVGNGGHVHLSIARDGRDLYSGGDGPFGMTGLAEAFTAGIHHRLPSLLAICAPSVASYLRLVPRHWAGAFSAWGWENREAPLRLVTGATGSSSWAANLEIKCVDQAANPYLVVAALLCAGMAGIEADLRLPEPVDRDPALLSEAERDRHRARRMPATLDEAVAAFEADDVLRAALGDRLSGVISTVRRGEIAALSGATDEEVVEALRWVH